MRGVYKFTNKINGKSYIGQSINLEQRYKTHLRRYNNPTDHCYNTKFYRALRKYTPQNFDYTILIQNDFLTKQDLNSLEMYWINYYDSYNNGYNSTLGGDKNVVRRKLSEQDVLKIKYELLNEPEKSLRVIAKEFNVSDGLIAFINKGECWENIGKYSYPLREKEILQNHKRGKNSRAKFSDEEVMEIRKQFVDKTLLELYQLYEERISFFEFKKIVYGCQFTHLSIYKKRKKQWEINKTCIDYPRLEE